MGNSLFIPVHKNPCFRIHQTLAKHFLDPAGCGSIFPAKSCWDAGSVKRELRWIWDFPVAQLVKNPPTMQETQFNSRVGKIHWRRDRLLTPVFRPEALQGLYSPWGPKEVDTTEWLSLTHSDEHGGWGGTSWPNLFNFWSTGFSLSSPWECPLSSSGPAFAPTNLEWSPHLSHPGVKNWV